MKRSKKIALTLIASISIGVSSCSQEQSTKREYYASKQRCAEDWGSDDKCEEDKNTPGYYYGPHYIYYRGYPHFFRPGGSEPEPLSAGAKFAAVPEGGRSLNSVRSVSSVHISRGIFGRAAGFHGASE